MIVLGRLLLVTVMTVAISLYGWGFVVQGLFQYLLLAVPVALVVVVAAARTSDGEAD